MKLEGIHHITAITGDAPANVEFYAGVLGLRLVKKSVNQDDPTVYHLFYGDDDGSPGADLTFFEYPHAARGTAGACRDARGARVLARTPRGARL
jgi:glyoxalase family protein